MTSNKLYALVEGHRAQLMLAGIRGIDLDYMLDPRVSEDEAHRALTDLLSGAQFKRWHEVRSHMSDGQWVYLLTAEPSIKEARALKLAMKELKGAFERQVLVYFKAAEARSAAEAKKAAKVAGARRAPMGRDA